MPKSHPALIAAVLLTACARSNDAALCPGASGCPSGSDGGVQALADGGPRADAGSAYGNLSIQIAGPQNLDAVVAVSGPHDFERMLTATSQTLSVPAGTYRLAASLGRAPGTYISTAYVPTLQGAAIEVQPGQTATFTVDFSARPGSGLWTSGYGKSQVQLTELSDAFLAGLTPDAGTPLTDTRSVFGESMVLDAQGNAWVTTSNSPTVQRYSLDAMVQGGPRTPDVLLTGPASVRYAFGLALDAQGGLFVSDSSAPNLERFALEQLSGRMDVGVTSAAVWSLDGGPGFTELAFDAQGNLWAAQTSNVFSASQPRIVELTRAQLRASADGGSIVPSSVIDLAPSLPPDGGSILVLGMAFDSAGDLWIGDYHGKQIFEFNGQTLGRTNTPERILPLGDSPGGLHSLAFDDHGDLWVSTLAPSHALLRFDPHPLPDGGAASLQAVYALPSAVLGMGFSPAPKTLPLPQPAP